jgi:predicted nuclease of restriction endonuclease-like (RecB) superfamily
MDLHSNFTEVQVLIKQAKEKAFFAVNTELIGLYWKIGEYVHQKIENSEWGKSVVNQLSDFIKQQEPEIKGFSSQNIWRMKQFYESYKDYPILSALVRELSWTNNLMIISKSTSIQEKEFYLKLAKKERYSSRELERQIDSGIFERIMLTDKKLSAMLRETHPKAEQTFKDNYILDFLGLPKVHSELDLRKAIVANLKDFILEFGRDFSFVGEEYRVQVGNKDFYVDLLFFHRDLQCLVAIDLKITDFQPEYLGKMEFYLEVLDNYIKKKHERPSVGIILCKNKDTKIVQFALNRSMSPTLVAKYETELIDKQLLERKLDEFFQLEQNNEIENDRN